MITRAAAPKGPVPGASQPGDGGLPEGYTVVADPTGGTTVVGPDGAPVPMDSTGRPIIAQVDPAGDEGGEGGEGGEDPDAEGPSAGPSPVADTNAGILGDDELLFSSVEIRELKVELSLSATRATAQDRLGVKLSQYACIGHITKGSIKERNERQAFDMSIDHNCFTGSVVMEGASEDGEG